MADLSSNKYDATWDDWREQLITMLEINGYNPSFCDIDEHTVAWDDYHNGVSVDDHFYKHYEADE